MKQQNDKAFYNLLTRSQKELLNNNDIDTPNNRITYLILANNIVIV